MTLTAHPSGDSRFSGWAAGGCGRDATCTVLMNESRVVTAHFQGFCIVPRVKGETLRAAKKNIRKAHCAAGKPAAATRRWSGAT